MFITYDYSHINIYVNTNIIDTIIRVSVCEKIIVTLYIIIFALKMT